MFRRFGVEIEQVGLTEDRARELFTQHNVNWKIKRDGSIRGTGCELVSPALPATPESLEEVRRVVALVNDAGADANVSCGLHVHIEARSLNASTIANIITRYAENEAEIDSFMPNSRRANNCPYSKSMIGHRAARDGQTIEQMIGRSTTSYIVDTDRYYKVNIKSYARHGTLEFRQHSGTVDPTKICNWIVFLQHFVQDSVVEQSTAHASVASELRGSQKKVLEILTASRYDGDANYLATTAGVTLDSLRCTISALRRRGHNIRLIRRTNTYVLEGRAAGDVSQARNVVRNRLWHSVPAQVKNFYEMRKVALAS